jgi:hypothetical protein
VDGAARLFGVSSFVGKSPVDVWQYLFSDAPARGVRPASLSAAAARAASFGALGTTLVNAAIGFVSGMVLATVIAIGFVLWKPFELAFMPIAMLLRSVPLVAMAPLLLLVFGQGKLGVAVIAGIVVLFPALVNIVLGAGVGAAGRARRRAGERRLSVLRAAAGADPGGPAAVPRVGADLDPGRDRRQHARRVARRVRGDGRRALGLQGPGQLRAACGRSSRSPCWCRSCSTS